MSVAQPRPRSRPPRWVVRTTILLLAVQATLGLVGVASQGVTNDETAHLAAGYSFWTLNDYRLQPENGNLPQRWCALPLLLLQPTLDPAAHPELWRLSDVWRIAHAFFFTDGNDSDRFLFAARAAMMLWGTALALLVQFWATRWWGWTGGLLALALTVFSPTVLAHAPLATSDVTATVCLLAALGGWWWCSHQLSFKTVLLTGLLTGLAFIAKFSAVLLLPMFAALAAVRLLSAAPIKWTWGSRTGEWSSVRAKAGACIALTVGHGLLTAAVIWTAFGWRYEAVNPAVSERAYFYKTNEIDLEAHDGVGAVVDWARTHQLLPEAYLQGFVFVRTHATARAAFLAGDFRDDGWWWFFPATFLWKSTLGELLVTAALTLALIVKLTRWRHTRVIASALYRYSPLLIFAAIYGGVSLASSLNIGQRHILPLYAILFIFAGGLVQLAGSRAKRALLLLPVAFSATACAAVFPHFLTYFNQPSGGSAQGWRKLVDSSLDWGQGLPALKHWLHENRRPEEVVYLSYFGSDDFRFRQIDAIPLAPSYQHYEPRRFEPLGPGLYCLTATMLQDVYSPIKGMWTPRMEHDYWLARTRAEEHLASGAWENRIVDFGRDNTYPLWVLERLRFARLTQYLRLREPDAVVANSIFVYRLSAHEVDTMVNGSLSAIADLMEQATATRSD